MAEEDANNANNQEEEEGYNTGSALETLMPAITYVVLPVGGALIGYQFVVQPLLSTVGIIDTNENQQEKNKQTDQLPTNPGNLPQPTISDAEAQSIADAQLSGMDQYGTDEGMLFNALQGLNGSDLRKVYKAFGNPYYNSWSGKKTTTNQILWSEPAFIDAMDLFGWYRNELGESNLQKMRKIWNKSKLKGL